jgi:4-amino-4-deoxy-L-arabinose transferase-like glycosyltransferase
VAADARHVRVIVACAVFAVLQVIIVVSGAADGAALCDDAFYYFQIAKNAARGSGFSFDGVYPTNGFHPLLAWIEVPVFALLGDHPWTPIRVILVLLGLSTAVTGYSLYRLGRSLGDERAGELMALFFLLSPFAWIIPLRGCEGGLAVLAVALGAWRLAALARAPITLRGAAQLGALVGLAGLARTENVFWALGVGGWLLWRTRSARVSLTFAFACAVVISPWVIWNLVTFGTIEQVSGAAKQAFRLYHPLEPSYSPVDVFENLRIGLYQHAQRYIVGEEFSPVVWADRFCAAGAAFIGLALIAGGRRRAPAVLAPIAVLVALHVGYYLFVQRSYFNWYCMPVVLGAAVLQGERLARARGRVTWPLVAASAVMCVAALALFIRRYPYEPRASERDIESGLRVLPQVPHGAHVAGWNVGRMGYFGSIRRPDLVFFNLDCVVNNQLFEAWKARRYQQWIVTHVDFLIERPLGAVRRDKLARQVDGVLHRIVADPSE